MSEMVDRVMKAIDDASTYGEGPRWRAELPGLARAAIEAMREPTRSMIEAGADGSGEDSENVATGAWEFMIDAALAPEKVT